MKFSTTFAALFVLAPFIAQQAVAVPQFGKGGFGQGQGAQGGKGGNAAAAKNAGKASSTAAKAASTKAAPTAAAAKGGNAAAAGGDLQNSLSEHLVAYTSCIELTHSPALDPSVLAKGFENDGQSQPAAGQVASKTSSNNFINFCATVPQLPITNGQQVKTGSCNPAPMGVIAATTKMPSSKFVFPPNGGNVAANKAFTIQMAIKNLGTGNFVNANENYFSAPQFTDNSGTITGHSHVVIEQLDSMGQTTPTDPTKFAFFKGLNDAAVNGVLTADVTSGLPAGTYRMASINSAANHQPVLVAVAQHGSLDDMVYFTVGGNGAAANNSAAGAGQGAAAAAGKGAAAAGKGAAAGNAAGKGAAGNAAAAGKGAAGNAAKGKGGKKNRRFAREYHH
ncbi:hypothetical protein OE88DRAFT_1746758 [Heliocybe sulcata]|uniref:Uncharacterized protein n=1 Tax=Heliocybe sulcata TaxID=5364 RepID=A0A5C3NIG3_9AGAM|nr:hypothetical protein OE88DRAFT_1746758 [Heliocybe sulcata]